MEYAWLKETLLAHCAALAARCPDQATRVAAITALGLIFSRFDKDTVAGPVLDAVRQALQNDRSAAVCTAALGCYRRAALFLGPQQSAQLILPKLTFLLYEPSLNREAFEQYASATNDILSTVLSARRAELAESAALQAAADVAVSRLTSPAPQPQPVVMAPPSVIPPPAAISPPSLPSPAPAPAPFRVDTAPPQQRPPPVAAAAASPVWPSQPASRASSGGGGSVSSVGSGGPAAGGDAFADLFAGMAVAPRPSAPPQQQQQQQTADLFAGLSMGAPSRPPPASGGGGFDFL
jgi:hypothetical protein